MGELHVRTATVERVEAHTTSTSAQTRFLNAFSKHVTSASWSVLPSLLPQWKPGLELGDYKIYRAFGIILMCPRFVLFAQYAIILFYTKIYKKTIIALSLIAAILYRSLSSVFPKTKLATVTLDDDTTDVEAVGQKSNVYIAWYIIAISETLLTVRVSCIWRVISFKGTHMAQCMSLPTLIILGE